MSLKPPKKSDLNKGWMKKRLDREIKIQLDIYGEGDNTLSLFEKAKKRAGRNPNGYKHIWVVYDTDDFPADHIKSELLYCIHKLVLCPQPGWEQYLFPALIQT